MNRFPEKFGMVVAGLLILAQPGFALEWISLHDQARGMTLAAAQALAEQQPEAIEDLYLIGLAHLKNYRYADARHVFEKILSLNPGLWEARWGLAEAWNREHRDTDSEPVLNEIAAAHPEFAPVFISLAYRAYLKMDWKGSAAYAEHIITSLKGRVDFTSDLQAHTLYAAAKGMLAHYGGPLSKTVNFTAVKRHLRIAEEMAPDSPEVYFGWGSFHMLIPKILGRDLDKAEEYIRKAIDADPFFPVTYVRLAQIYKYRRDEKRYEEYLQQALALDPQNQIAHDIRMGKCKFICLQ